MHRWFHTSPRWLVAVILIAPALWSDVVAVQRWCGRPWADKRNSCKWIASSCGALSQEQGHICPYMSARRGSDESALARE